MQPSYGAAKDASISVTVQPINNVVIYPIHDFPATVISSNNSILSAEIAATVHKINYQVGDIVSKGEPLIELDATEATAALIQTQAKLDGLEVEYKFKVWQLSQSKKLKAANNLSAEELFQIETTANALKANLMATKELVKTAERNVSKCIITAPFKGVVINRLVNLGEFVTPGTGTIQVIDLDTVELEANLHNKEIELLRGASKLEFVANEISYPVSIRTIVAHTDPESRTQVARFVFHHDNPLPGTPGRIVWRSHFPAIPTEYIRQIGDKRGVFMVANNKAKFIHLPDSTEGQPSIIKEPIGEHIIIDGRFVVQDGMTVKIQNLDDNTQL